MKDENYVHIAGWMINKLHLTGNELTVYALIYGFSQDEQNVFTGNLEYIADWLNIGRATAQRIVDKLVKDGLVERIETTVKGHRTYNYRAIG